MAQRNTIGLLFSYNENWIGGSYYILHLISAFDTLPIDEKPHLVIFITNHEDKNKVLATGYPYLEFVNLDFTINFYQRIINKISRFLLGVNLFKPAHKMGITDFIFPYNLQESLRNIPYKITWIPDFQEHYLPDMFLEKNLHDRKEHQKNIVQLNLPIIFSSVDSQNSFHKIYPHAKNKTFVVNFATTHEQYDGVNIDFLTSKYAITKPYAIAPNQFWKHKNHQVILDTLLLLKQEGKLNFQIVFTGKEHDFRYPEYTNDLKKYVINNKLEEYVSFLGFIDRKEQLQLMAHAKLVIQPSLFEGWSSVVEDAKAMSQYIVASQIAVHREQLDDYPNKYFFNPNSPLELKEIIYSLFNKNTNKTPYFYQENICNFAKKFLNIAKIITQNK